MHRGLLSTVQKKNKRKLIFFSPFLTLDMEIKKQKKALFIGLTTIDLQYFTNEHPKPNTKVKCAPPLISIGGPATNAAITAAFLGLETTMIGCIGDNAFSGFINQEYNKYGLTFIDSLNQNPHPPMLVSVVTNLLNGDRTVLTQHPCIAEILPPHNVDIVNFDLVFTDGFYPELALPLLHEAKKQKIPVYFDGGSWKPRMDEILHYVDVAICSADFFPPEIKTHADIFPYMKEMGVSQTMITRGDKPILWSDGKHINETAVLDTQVVDTLGAGDVFHGAFCYYASQGHSLDVVISASSKIASFSTQYKGAQTWMEFFKVRKIF